MARPQCQATTRPAAPFAAPAPYPSAAPVEGHFWHGQPELWTMLPADGQWLSLPEVDGGLRQIILWWREALEAEPQAVPDLAISGWQWEGATSLRQLKVEGITTAYHLDYLRFFAAAVIFPAPGCWTILAERGAVSLRFVIWVEGGSE